MHDRPPRQPVSKRHPEKVRYELAGISDLHFDEVSNSFSAFVFEKNSQPCNLQLAYAHLNGILRGQKSPHDEPQEAASHKANVAREEL
mmetsp:Transcript_17792/g.71679  ORF Transcript_17792/g.71679 Transcript_17792/m.71679 type:complete len:88 (-) Transcript_17792:250-513(-)